MHINNCKNIFKFFRTFLFNVLTAITIFLAINSQSLAQSNTNSIEYQLKASLIFNFIFFIQWPENTFNDNNIINICLFGNDPYGKYLDSLHGKLIQENRLSIYKYSENTTDSIDKCAIALLNFPDRESTQKQLELFSGKSVLTIGERQNFMQDGGVIKLKVIDDGIKFDININAATKAGLDISSKLLRLADKVKTDG